MSQKILFEKIVSDGKAMGYWHDKAVFAVGPLPGETAEVAISRERKTWSESTLRRITQPSEHRYEPLEEHYLSCSPWQGVEYDFQVELKRQMLAEIFAQPGLNLTVEDFRLADVTTGYRNKLEFSVHEFAGQYKLAFHKRGKFDGFVEAETGCVLGAADMNVAAREVLERVVKLDLAHCVETITVRQSRQSRAVVAIIGVNKLGKEADWTKLERPSSVVGCRVVMKEKHNQFATLALQGDTDLSETVGGVAMNYPWDSFFQVNLDVFELVLADIRRAIVPAGKVLDLYGGAGTIGLALAQDGYKVVGVEVVDAAVELANTNARLAGLANYNAVCAPAEKLSDDSFAGYDAVIVDPPRSGLHADVIRALLKAKPRQIIYISCNPVTQARDVLALSDSYDLSGVTGYDQYPGTLHLESLLVLSLKN